MSQYGLPLASQIMYYKSKGFSLKQIAQKLAIHKTTAEKYPLKNFLAKEMADWVHKNYRGFK